MALMTCYPYSFYAQSYKPIVCWADSISHYKEAIEFFPSTSPVNADYLNNAYNLALACLEGRQQYEVGERLASQALVRASAVADSSIHCGYLFSFLAKFYEQRGDTIMPDHFHRKAQIISLRHQAKEEHPDSVDIYNDRITSRFEQLDYVKQFYDKKRHLYIEELDDLCGMVYNSGNYFETLWLAEQVLTLAHVPIVDDSLGICMNARTRLPACYAATRQFDKLELSIKEAVDYSKRFPEKAPSESWLYYSVGCGLAVKNYYDEAMIYFKKARNKSIPSDKDWNDELKQVMKACKQKQQKK